MTEVPPVSKKLLVTSSPHVFDQDSVSRIMWEVNLALVPAFCTAFYVFGLRAVFVVLVSILGALFGEALIQFFFLGKPVAIRDGSAVVTGILLAFCVPVSLPLWIVFIGGFLGIVLGKQVYGGLGQNIFNPAHVARAILLASWPLQMTTWVKPGISIDYQLSLDGFTQATPLGFLKETLRNPETMASLQASATSALQHTFAQLDIGWANLLTGSMGGSLGETGKIALLLGGLYLLIRGHITWHIPATMIGTVFFGSLLFTGSPSMALFHLLAGGLFIGAFFMATDMVTSPMTRLGQGIFGVGCGLITLLIRFKGGYPEGVCYSILIMNSLVPLIDRFTAPRRFGVNTPSMAEAKA